MNPATMKVADVMRADVIRVRPDQTIAQLDELLARHRITGAPVVDGDRVVGVVSRSDVVRQLELERSRFESLSWYLEPFDAEDRAPALDEEVSNAVAKRLSGVLVRELMTKDVLSIGADASLAEAARLMVEHRVHRLLVMRGAELAGLVSSLDLLRGLGQAA
jgi:CBS domain-containing protein